MGWVEGISKYCRCILYPVMTEYSNWRSRQHLVTDPPMVKVISPDSLNLLTKHSLIIILSVWMTFMLSCLEGTGMYKSFVLLAQLLL